MSNVNWEPQFTYDSVVSLFEESGAEFLDDFYGNQHTVHNFRCSCGYEGTTRVITFKKKRCCKYCAHRRGAEGFTHSLEDVRDIFKDHGYELTDDSYVNVDTPMECLCVCGSPTKLSVTAVRKGSKCSNCFKERMSGENNPRWNPNLTDGEREKNRDTSEYREWRNDVFKKDDFTCQDCGERGVNLNAHHIIPFSVNESLRLDVGNGVTLCDECHKRIHSSEEGMPLTEMNEDSYVDYIQRHSFSPEVEIDFDYETGEVCYSTVIS